MKFHLLVYLIICLNTGCKFDSKNKESHPIKKLNTNEKEEHSIDKYLVTASKGLIVRSQPKLTEQKINTLPYKTEVSVVEKTNNHQIIDDNGYKIKRKVGQDSE